MFLRATFTIPEIYRSSQMIDTVLYEFLYRWHTKTVKMYDLKFVNFREKHKYISRNCEPIQEVTVTNIIFPKLRQS